MYKYWFSKGVSDPSRVVGLKDRQLRGRLVLWKRRVRLDIEDYVICFEREMLQLGPIVSNPESAVFEDTDNIEVLWFLFKNRQYDVVYEYDRDETFVKDKVVSYKVDTHKLCEFVTTNMHLFDHIDKTLLF